MPHPTISIPQLFASVPMLWFGMALSALGLAVVLQFTFEALGLSKPKRRRGWEELVLGAGAVAFFWSVVWFLLAHSAT